ncbi:hypothetical protein DV737_g283, partial [Chaetothyriales sp. CBS 132003]
MADQHKYSPPEGQPPSYPPLAHHDAGPYNPSASPAPGPMNQVAYYHPARAPDGTFYGPSQDRAQYAQEGPYQQPYNANQQPYYANQQPYYANQQPYYANQPPMYYQQPAQGYFPDRSLGHRFALIAIGILAGIILVFLITLAKNHLRSGRLKPGHKDEIGHDPPVVPGAFGCDK